jgi:hypothetical protein
MGIILPFDDVAMGMAMFSDPLGEHLLYTTAEFPYDFDNRDFPPHWHLSYINRSFSPTFLFDYCHSKYYPWFVDEDDDDEIARYYNWLSAYTLRAFQPVKFRHKRFRSAGITAGISYLHYHQPSKFDDNEYQLTVPNQALLTLGTAYRYNLPWRNDWFHPVRQFETNALVAYSNESLGMGTDSQIYNANLSFAFAPLLNISNKSSHSDRITLQNRTSYTLFKGWNDIHPIIPSINLVDFIAPLPDITPYHRNQRIQYDFFSANEILLTQTDLNLKFTDSVMTAGSGVLPSFGITYIGGSLWADHLRMTNERISPNQPISETTLGVELRAAVHLFSLPILNTVGQAWNIEDPDRNHTYFTITIPISKFLSSVANL